MTAKDFVQLYYPEAYIEHAGNKWKIFKNDEGYCLAEGDTIRETWHDLRYKIIKNLEKD
jgi:hypothetical protein